MKHIHQVGVDISDSSIKLLELDKDRAVRTYGNIELPEGVVNNGSIENKEAFSRELNELLRTTKPLSLIAEDASVRAVLCLPEAKLFTHTLAVPASVKRSELDEYVRTESAKIIPFELSSLYWDYHLSEIKALRKAAFVGVLKADLDNYVEAFSHANVQPAFIGGELFSLGQALLPPGNLEPHLILDIGARSTTIGIFNGSAIAEFSIVVPYAGDFFTAQIAERLELTQEEAEQQKRTYGVLEADTKTKVSDILKDALGLLVQEVLQLKMYFEEKEQVQVSSMTLAGGSALLPGILEYFSEATNMSATIANPFIQVTKHDALESGTAGILFANVVGLALYALRNDGESVNLLTKYRYEKSDGVKERLQIGDIRSLSDLYYVCYSTYTTLQKRLHSLRERVQQRMDGRMRLIASLLFLGVTLVFLIWVVYTYM